MNSYTRGRVTPAKHLLTSDRVVTNWSTVDERSANVVDAEEVLAAIVVNAAALKVQGRRQGKRFLVNDSTVGGRLA